MDTAEPTESQWIIVIALSLVTPALVAIDKFIQDSRERKAPAGGAARYRRCLGRIRFDGPRSAYPGLIPKRGRDSRAVDSWARSSLGRQTADAVRVPLPRPSSLVHRQGVMVIGVLAASDLAYRLLLREPVRRALGMSPLSTVPSERTARMDARPWPRERPLGRG